MAKLKRKYINKI